MQERTKNTGTEDCKEDTWTRKTVTMEGKRGRPHKDGRTRIKKKVFKYNGSKDQAGNGQRPSGMEEDYIRSHGLQRTVVLESKTLTQ